MFVGSVSKEQKPSVVAFTVIDSVVSCLSRFCTKCQDVFWESRQLLMSLSRAFVLKTFNGTAYDSHVPALIVTQTFSDRHFKRAI